jgi:predicted phage tail protein
LFDNRLDKFRRGFQTALKNSTAQNWHKTAQKSELETGFVRSQKSGPLSTSRHAIQMVERELPTRCAFLIAQRLVPIFRIAPNPLSRTWERKMAPRERISIGPFEAEGPRTTFYIAIIVAAALGAAFYLGKLSALFDSCFGLKL